MANLAMAIPEMMSGAPEDAAGAEDSIVTEKTFVEFSNQYLSLNKKIIDNKQRVQRVRERIDMMIERRNRRVGAPEKAVEDEEKEEEEKSNIFGDILKKLLDLAKSLIKSFIFFAKKLLTGLLKFLGKIFLLKKMMPIIKKVFNGLLGKKLKLFKALGLGAVFGGLLALFSGSGSDAKEPPDFVGDGDDTEAPAPVVEEVDVAAADFVGDGDDTEAPAPVVEEVDVAVADFVGDGDDTEAPTPAPAPVVAAPVVKPAPPAPEPPPPPPVPKPKPKPPAPPAAAAPKPVPTKVSAPAKPQRVPEAVAKKQPGTPVKKDALDREFESGDARAKKINDLILKENQLNDKIKEITFKTLPAANAAADKKFPDGYQTMEAGAEAYAPEVAKLEQLLSKLKKEERQVSAEIAELYNQKRKADEGDFEISDKEFEMGADQRMGESSESSTSTVKKQEKVVQTKTETQTGGGSTVRTSAQKADTEKTKELRAELKKVKAERRSIIKQLRAQGMGFGKATKDPRFLEIKARYEELEDLIEKSRVVVSAGSVTRTPGKNIRKTSTKVIVKPVVVKTETRVRQ